MALSERLKTAMKDKKIITASCHMRELKSLLFKSSQEPLKLHHHFMRETRNLLYTLTYQGFGETILAKPRELCELCGEYCTTIQIINNRTGRT